MYKFLSELPLLEYEKENFIARFKNYHNNLILREYKEDDKIKLSSFFTPILSSFIIKDLLSLKKFRSIGHGVFDVNQFFKFKKFEEFIFCWITDSLFISKLIWNCKKYNINILQMSNILFHFNISFYNHFRHVDKNFNRLHKFIEAVPTDYANYYKEQYKFSDQLFNYFYEIEKILQWSPSISFHKMDNDTIFFSHEDLVKFFIQTVNI